MKSKILRATAANNSIRLFVADTTAMVENARTMHNASPVAIAALGRTLTATSIMGIMLKSDKQKITVKINGGGPLGPIVVVANAFGNVKGYVANPQTEGTFLYDNKLNVGEAVGANGEIVVVKDIGLKEPYSGTYPLVSGEIAEDFAAYFLYSEQQPSAVGLGVLVDVDYSVKAAGGFIIQVMPDINENLLFILENRLKELEPVSTLLSRDMGAEAILDYIIGDMEHIIHETYEVDFVCDCHEERLENALISIGREALTEIIEEDEGAEMVCHFCNKKYYFNKERLMGLLKDMK